MLASLLLAASCTALPPPITLAADDQRLTAGVEALIDPDRSLKIADVLQRPACQHFIAQSHSPNFGARKSGVWLRFRTPALAGTSDWRLVVRFVGLEKVCAYFPRRDG